MYTIYNESGDVIKTVETIYDLMSWFDNHPNVKAFYQKEAR